MDIDLTNAQLTARGVAFVARRDDGVTQRFRVTKMALEDLENAAELMGEALLQAFESHAQRISEVAGVLLATRSPDETTWIITIGHFPGGK